MYNFKSRGGFSQLEPSSKSDNNAFQSYFEEALNEKSRNRVQPPDNSPLLKRGGHYHVYFWMACTACSCVKVLIANTSLVRPDPGHKTKLMHVDLTTLKLLGACVSY